MYRIFIVEDDIGIAGAIQKQTESWGMEAKCAEDFHDIMAEFAACRPQLVLMDISLPFFNGYYWCQKIREVSKVPVIFISSASDNLNIVIALQAGADDFIAKPFDFSVLMAKIQAVLRRTYDYGTQVSVLEHRGALLSKEDALLHYQGRKIDLTKNEYRILLTLMEQKGKIVSRERLMEKLWENDSFVDENTLSVNVNRLRKKLEKEGLTGFITTKVGMGYLIESVVTTS
ncbi:MAG TPA: response regulator transcription factor [Candidatus Blautia stercoravium]|nr:response regulator transcription factor [Candidatus Blautia stercoravium]